MSQTATATTAGPPAEAPPPRGNVAWLLSQPFSPDEVKFKPQSVKNDRALAIPYIDARSVIDRLDEVLGPENWEDEYDLVGDGSVRCRLKLRVNGEWVAKTDVGSPSEQPDGGDRLKAAFSDALKRAAVKWGIGRYLYRLSAQWWDYDPVNKRFKSKPPLPAWAVAKPGTVQMKQMQEQALPAKKGPPQTAEELVHRLRVLEAEMVKQQKCKPSELIAHTAKFCKMAGHAEDLMRLDKAGVAFAVKVVTDFHNERNPNPLPQGQAAPSPPASPPPPQPPPEEKVNPKAVGLTVRDGLLRILRQKGVFIEKEYKEPLDHWLSREVHHGLTLAAVESEPEVWTNDTVAEMVKRLGQYIDGGIPH